MNQQVLESIVREIAQGGNTIIFSTHVMEHAERLCDRIILMAGGRKVFDGSTELALSKAPRRMVIASENAALVETITPMASALSRREDGAYQLTLNPKAETHSLLEACVKGGIRLSRFEPKPQSLHEAFVAMVGEDVLKQMDVAEGLQ